MKKIYEERFKMKEMEKLYLDLILNDVRERTKHGFNPIRENRATYHAKYGVAYDPEDNKVLMPTTNSSPKYHLFLNKLGYTAYVVKLKDDRNCARAVVVEKKDSYEKIVLFDGEILFVENDEMLEDFKENFLN